MKFIKLSILPLAVLLISFACKKSATDTTTSTTTGTATVPEVYKKIYGATSISSDGTYLTIKTTGTPDHKSIYYATSNSLYENFSGTTFGGRTFTKNPKVQRESYANSVRVSQFHAKG